VNTPRIAEDLTKDDPHSLSARIAQFALAINGPSARDVSVSDSQQSQRELTCEPGTDLNEAVL
jgi:hypothetical protein